MRRKKNLYAITVAALTMMSGIGPRTFAAVPPGTNVEKEAKKEGEEEKKPEATVPPGEAGYEEEDQKISETVNSEEAASGEAETSSSTEEKDSESTEVTSSKEEMAEEDSGMETSNPTVIEEESTEETPDPTEIAEESTEEMPDSPEKTTESSAETPDPAESFVEEPKVTEEISSAPDVPQEEPDSSGESTAPTGVPSGTPAVLPTDKPESAASDLNDRVQEEKEEDENVAAAGKPVRTEAARPTEKAETVVIVTPTARDEPAEKAKTEEEKKTTKVPEQAETSEGIKKTDPTEKPKQEEKDQFKKQEENKPAAQPSAQKGQNSKGEKGSAEKTSAVGNTVKNNPTNHVQEEIKMPPVNAKEHEEQRFTIDTGARQKENLQEDMGPTGGENSMERDISSKLQEMKQETEQTVQKTAPEIRVDGVRDRATSQSSVDLSAHIKSKDLAASDIHAVIKDTETGKTIEGKVTRKQDGYKVTFPKVSDDGHYQMTVRTEDGEGKVSSEKKVAFTVNQHGGAAYLATEDLAGAKVNRPVSPEFVVADVDENAELRATVNGRQVGTSYNKEGKLVLDQEITKEGRYVVRVEGKDSAGHEIKSKPVEFVIDKTKPRVWMKTKQTAKGLMVEVFHDVPEDHIESILVDDVTMEAADYTDENGKSRFLLDKEGAHTVKVTVKDAAGNRTERTQTLRVSASHSARKKSGRLKTVWIVAAMGTAGIVLLVFFVLSRLVRH